MQDTPQSIVKALTFRQEAASAILKQTTYVASKLNIVKAAQVMDKTLSAETLATLDTLSGSRYSDLGPLTLAYLTRLGAEILS